MVRQLGKKAQRFLPLTYLTLKVGQTVDLGRYVQFPAGFHGLNPAVVRYGSGFLVCLRCINYVYSGADMARPVFTVGDRYMTANRFVLLDRSFRLQRALPGLDDVFDDIEDIKLFEFDGRIMGVGSCPTPDGGRAIGLLTVDVDAQRGTCQLLASPFGLRYEKNWAPFVRDGVLHFVYSFAPLVVVRVDPATGGVLFADPVSAGVAKTDLGFVVGGSSAGLPVAGGFLFAAHRRRISLPRMHRAYLSRMYFLDPARMTLRAGRYFSIGPASIQFLNGFEERDEDVVLTYSAMERNGFICRVPKAHFRPMLPPGIPDDFACDGAAVMQEAG